MNEDKTRALEEARTIFQDVRDFFESDKKRMYLTTVISEENVRKVLDEIECIFAEDEDYEKCSQIVAWRNQLKDKKV